MCCHRAASRSALALALASTLLPTALAAPACERDGMPVLERVGTHTWRVAAARGEPADANGGLTAQLVVVRDGARVWLIGSGPTPAFGAALACAIRQRVGQSVTDVVNTRAAPELAMGNDAFAGARLWALPEVIAAMRARCAACLQRLKARLGVAGDSLQPARIRVPFAPVGRTGAARGTLGPFAWRALPRADDETVLVLRHRRDRLVVAQGLLWADDVPDLRDARSDTMLASLHALHAFATGARVLGDQGDVVPREALARHVAYIDALRHAVLQRLARGDVEGASGSSMELPDYATLPSYAAVHPLNVQRVWRELEAALFR